ncbi:MAG: HNH endonuclease [Shimia thalassica]|uniref:HNH endonuclease n=1 Tax=Shimia thalassica TaxID=1715693 RepID=UPI0032972444
MVLVIDVFTPTRSFVITLPPSSATTGGHRHPLGAYGPPKAGTGTNWAHTGHHSRDTQAQARAQPQPIARPPLFVYLIHTSAITITATPIRGTHMAKYRGDLAQRFYQSREWRTFRNRMVAILRRHPCARCGHPFTETDKRVQLDHIIEVKVDWSRRLDPRNVRLLHLACHTHHTHHDEGRKPVGVDGLPEDWQ